ncbi:MAG: nuclear transport factor 2 family protein [Bacteroidota bacterium]
MTSNSLLPLFVGLLACSTLAFLHHQTDSASKKEVEAVVLQSYIHGAFNELNPEAMQAGFHPDFAIFSAKGEEIDKYPIEEWVSSVKKRKNKLDFDPAGNQWEHRFSQVDITGGAATVKVELSRKGKHIYTDYLSLLKFESGWRIVAKVYHKHP